jgi:hypothetical protein
MSTQDQVNSYANQYILYYAGFVQSDPTIFQVNLSDICYTSIIGGVLQIGGWQPVYATPTNAQLLSYAFATVNSWYVDNYGDPNSIKASQPFILPTADISAMRSDPSMIGYIVIDSTAQIPKVYNGSSWVPVSLGGGGTYLPLAGGNMAGAIDMKAHDVLHVANLSGATYTRTADNILSCATAGVSGDVLTFTGSAKVAQDSGVLLSSLATTASLSAYLPLAGGNMAGAIDMKANDVLHVANLSGATNTRTADNIVSNAGASVDTRIATFSGVSGKVIQDSGHALSEYLQLAGGTMSGDLNMGSHNLASVASVDSSGALTIAGTSATSLGLGRSGVLTTCLGNFTTGSQAFASLLRTTPYGPSFTANVIQLIPPAASVAGPLSQFTQISAGVFQYTGSRTRTFTISCGVVFTAPNGANMTFLASLNGNTALGGSQVFITEDVYVQNASKHIAVSFTDTQQLLPTTTVQLAASCTITTAGVSIVNSWMSIVGMLD